MNGPTLRRTAHKWREYRCVTGNSNKEYFITVTHGQDGDWMVVGWWGRIGCATLQSKCYAEGVSLFEARRVETRLSQERVDKGYTFCGSGGITLDPLLPDNVLGPIPPLPLPQPPPIIPFARTGKRRIQLRPNR